jgi:deoxycytidylate deaminase
MRVRDQKFHCGVKNLLTALTEARPSIISSPEIVFGIVGPIGINIEPVVASIERTLYNIRYDCFRLHLTDYIDHPRITTKMANSSYFDKYSALISRGNEYRKIARSNDAFAGLAITLIQKKRNELTGSLRDPRPQTAYIVRQFKRPEEIDLMRRVYGQKFIQVSIYGSEQDRFNAMVKKIMSFNSSPRNEHVSKQEAIKLIQMDSDQSDEIGGQQVSKVFHLGDVFVDGIDADNSHKTIERFINALFGSSKSSPTKDEHGLYLASAAALRSADLSRQVGAAICTSDGEVISIGCNEVPKARGGAYWIDGEDTLARDVEQQMDPNHERRRQIVHDFIQRLDKKGWISDALENKFDSDGMDDILKEELIKNSQVMDVLEF